MAKFDWRIDSANYLSGDGDKIRTKDFLQIIAASLNEYRKYEMDDILSGRVSYCHICADLERKTSREAKKLLKHLEAINSRLGLEGIAIEPSRILQLKIKRFPNKSEFRCYGYVIDDGYFYLVHLDPSHQIYKE